MSDVFNAIGLPPIREGGAPGRNTATIRLMSRNFSNAVPARSAVARQPNRMMGGGGPQIMRGAGDLTLCRLHNQNFASLHIRL